MMSLIDPETIGGRQLLKLAAAYDVTLEGLFSAATFDGLAPSICTVCEEYTTDLEPDAENCSCCEICDDGGSVTSCLIIGGII